MRLEVHEVRLGAKGHIKPRSQTVEVCKVALLDQRLHKSPSEKVGLYDIHFQKKECVVGKVFRRLLYKKMLFICLVILISLFSLNKIGFDNSR